MGDILYEFKRFISKKQSVFILIIFVVVLLFDQYLLVQNSAVQFGDVIYHHATVYFRQQNDAGWTILPIIMPLLVMGWFGFLFLEEKETSILDYSLTRISGMKYITKKIILLNTLSFVITFSLMSILFVFFLFRYPVSSSLSVSEYAPYYASEVFNFSTYIYSVILILNTSFMSVLITQVMILLTLFSSNKGSLFAKGLLFIYIIPYSYKFATTQILPYENFNFVSMAAEYQSNVRFFMTPVLYWGSFAIVLSLITIMVFNYLIKKEKLV